MGGDRAIGGVGSIVVWDEMAWVKGGGSMQCSPSIVEGKAKGQGDGPSYGRTALRPETATVLKLGLAPVAHHEGSSTLSTYS